MKHLIFERSIYHHFDDGKWNEVDPDYRQHERAVSYRIRSTLVNVAGGQNALEA